MEELLQQWERQQIQWELGEGMEILRRERELERAERYWEERRNKVWNVSREIGLEELHNDCEDESFFNCFVIELFGEGEYEASENEIAEGLKEMLTDRYGAEEVRECIERELVHLVCS